MIAGFIAGLVAAIVIVIVLAIEQRDKEYRQENNLPPKKYHDITDHDVTIVHTIRYK